jgi:CheY-like chemotaxis protein
MPRILIVEDSNDVRFIISEILRRKGFETAEASNGVQALEFLDGDSRIDLIISDVRMAKMGGLELLSELKQRFPHIPTIMLSVHTVPEWIEQARQRGAVSYLTKPFTPDQLVSAIEQHLVSAAS